MRSRHRRFCVPQRVGFGRRLQPHRIILRLEEFLGAGQVIRHPPE
jgi:hypothetical protein